MGGEALVSHAYEFARLASTAARRLLWRAAKFRKSRDAATSPQGPLESILKKLDLNYVPGLDSGLKRTQTRVFWQSFIALI
jgi:hypothetical protein